MSREACTPEAALHCPAGQLHSGACRPVSCCDTADVWCPQVPAAAPLEGLREAVRQDVHARAAVGAADKLSVLMFTFLNTGRSLSSVAFTADASQVAGARLEPCACCTRLASTCVPLHIANFPCSLQAQAETHVRCVLHLSASAAGQQEPLAAGVHVKSPVLCRRLCRL